MIQRMRLLLAVVLTVLVIFTGRLVWLQLASTERFANLSESNATQQRRIAPLRGRILARDGTILADNRVAYDLMYWGGEIEGWTRLARLLGMSEPPAEPNFSDPQVARNGAVIAWNLPDSLVPAIEERVAGQENLYLRERIERVYPTNLAAQSVGYTGLANPERNIGYAIDDMVGLSGLEAGFETDLFGQPGLEIVEVNNRGIPVRRQVALPAQPGLDVWTTLDPNAQRAAEDVLEDAVDYINAYRASEDIPAMDVTRGALLVMDLKTGEVLAMASAPTFDQNVFTRRPSDPEAVRTILGDERLQPLQNRAIEAFAPASTFKMLSSYTLLEHGFVAANERFECSTSVTYGDITWHNWIEGYRGNYDVRQAIADSCNTYYFRAAMDTPDFTEGWGSFMEALHDDAIAFGYGQAIGIGLPGERDGVVPDPAYVREVRDTSWFPGYTLNSVIGQGDVLATPLQTLRALSAFALEGTLVEPRLVSRVGGEAYGIESSTVPGSSWDVLAEGMRAMVTDFGSSRILGPAAAFPITIAGKTGTAQNGQGEGYEHTWFMAYAPVSDPEIGVVAFLENAGSSIATVVPMARDFFVAYYDLPVPIVEGARTP